MRRSMVLSLPLQQGFPDAHIHLSLEEVTFLTGHKVLMKWMTKMR
jgi:hypothetical protein